MYVDIRTKARPLPWASLMYIAVLVVVVVALSVLVIETGRSVEQTSYGVAEVLEALTSEQVAQSHR